MAGGSTGGSGGSLEQARDGVVERLRARRGELAREIVARVRGDAFDRAGEDDAEYVAGLGATVAAALEYVLAGIERGEDGAEPIPAVALEQARRAARLGVSLDTVLRRYVAGSALLGELIMEEGDRGERDGNPPIQRRALREALRAQALGLERMLAAVTAAYGDELARAGRSPEQRHFERVRRLLDGRALERPELDYELDAWHLGVIATGAGAAQAVRQLAGGAGRRLLRVAHGEQSVWAWLGGRQPFAVGDVQRIAVYATVNDGVVLALGEPARDLEGWRLTHRQAQASLRVALRRREPGGVTRYADVALLAFALTDETLARSLIEIYLSPLNQQRDGGAVLRETLRAYLAAGRNATSAAAKLNVTRHTVTSRMLTLEQRLGRGLQTCLAELELALRLEELDGFTPGTKRPPE